MSLKIEEIVWLFLSLIDSNYWSHGPFLFGLFFSTIFSIIPILVGWLNLPECVLMFLLSMASGRSVTDGRPVTHCLRMFVHVIHFLRFPQDFSNRFRLLILTESFYHLFHWWMALGLGIWEYLAETGMPIHLALWHARRDSQVRTGSNSRIIRIVQSTANQRTASLRGGPSIDCAWPVVRS